MDRREERLNRLARELEELLDEAVLAEMADAVARARSALGVEE